MQDRCGAENAEAGQLPDLAPRSAIPRVTLSAWDPRTIDPALHDGSVSARLRQIKTLRQPPSHHSLARIFYSTRETDAAPCSSPHSPHFEGAEDHRRAAGPAAFSRLVLRMTLAQSRCVTQRCAKPKKTEEPGCVRSRLMPAFCSWPLPDRGRGPQRPTPITAPISPGAGAPPAMWSHLNRHRRASICASFAENMP
jgi:hypothetical protein